MQTTNKKAAMQLDKTTSGKGRTRTSSGSTLCIGLLMALFSQGSMAGSFGASSWPYSCECRPKLTYLPYPNPSVKQFYMREDAKDANRFYLLELQAGGSDVVRPSSCERYTTPTTY